MLELDPQSLLVNLNYLVRFIARCFGFTSWVHWVGGYGIRNVFVIVLSFLLFFGHEY